MSVIGTAKLAYRKGRLLKQLVKREWESMKVVPLPLGRRIRLWSWGFISESDLLYEITPENRRLYVTDYEYVMKTPFINGVYNPTLNDKVVFFHTMRSVQGPTPAIYGVVRPDRQVAWIDFPAARPPASVLELLEGQGELVVKPYDGGRGGDVAFLGSNGAGLQVNGKAADEGGVEALLRPGIMICQRVRQGRFASEVFPDATNTLRVMTMWDYQRGEPFVCLAIHRFGTHKSAPVDNVSGGGVMAGIDIESGTMTAAVGLHESSLVWHSVHPDTGAQIEGATIPGWHAMTADLLRVAERLAAVPYIGWDVLLGDDGYFIIEGNSYPDVSPQVVCGPLLADPRVRRFYEHHGVVPT